MLIHSGRATYLFFSLKKYKKMCTILWYFVAMNFIQGYHGTKTVATDALLVLSFAGINEYICYKQQAFLFTRVCPKKKTSRAMHPYLLAI